MNRILLLAAAIFLAGCFVPPGPTTTQHRSPGLAEAERPAPPRPCYEHQLEWEYSDGATPFLRLVEVRQP